MLPASLPIWLIQSAGAAQIVLALGSLAIPGVLRWNEDTKKLQPLTREIFWTYAGYIFTSHLCFGFLSLLLADSLVDGSPLAAAVTGFIAAWWSARVVIQFTCLDRSAAPPGAFFRVAEILLVLLFVSLAGHAAFDVRRRPRTAEGPPVRVAEAGRDQPRCRSLPRDVGVDGGIGRFLPDYCWCSRMGGHAIAAAGNQSGLSLRAVQSARRPVAVGGCGSSRSVSSPVTFDQPE
jgi:hypothetical protein